MIGASIVLSLFAILKHWEVRTRHGSTNFLVDRGNRTQFIIHCCYWLIIRGWLLLLFYYVAIILRIDHLCTHESGKIFTIFVFIFYYLLFIVGIVE
jgi:hypothetical protein